MKNHNQILHVVGGAVANSSTKPPAHLSAEAKNWWRRIVDGWDIDEDGLLVLRVALEAFDRLCEARKMISRDGIVIKNRRTGGMRAHPAILIEKESRLGLLRAWRQLGLDIELPGVPGRPLGRNKLGGRHAT